MVHIQVEHLSHRYGDGALSRLVLDDINLDADQARIGVVGHNGSGKSTFVRMLDALLTPTSGRVLVDGVDVATDPAAVRRMTGFLFTDPDSQIIMPTVAEDVAFGLRRAKLSREETNDRVDAMLERYGLSSHRDHPAHLLSGGQKQLLALASVLITEPRMLIMDEPTTLLDLRNARRFAAVVRELPQTVVLATHQLDLLKDFDRVLVFDGGKLVADDEPAPALAHYRSLMD